MKKGLFLLFCWVGLGGFFSETFGQIQRIDTTSTVKKGGIIGTIQDSTGYTIPMAHVFLIQGKDTVKLVSDLDGRFTYKGISSDTVRLWVSAVGYKPLEEDYIPSQHGLCIRVVLQEDIFSLDEVSVEAKNYKSRRYWRFTYQRIDAQDTMLFGIFDISLPDHFHPAHLPRYIDFYHPHYSYYWYSEKKQAEIRELERKIIDLQRHKNEGLLENQSRIQALQKLITELKKQPDQALRTTAQAKGQTVREYRKETVQNLETVLKRLKEVNSQRYIDHQIRSSIERLSALRAHQSKVLDSQLVAERYKAKRWIASKMVDGKLHNYVGTLGHKRGLICVSRLKYHPLCQREIQAWGFVDYEVREVIPCQYGWAFNRLLLLCRHRWTNTLIKFKSSPIPPWIEVPWPYRDSLGWITVGDFINQELMGMIDRENNVMIPLKFFWMEDRHEWIEFFYTPEGDFAPVTVKKEDKLLDGIIDRKGNFTLEPVYETPIFWDKKRHCFYTDREQGKEEEEEKERIYFNAYGEEIKNTK